MPRKLNRNAFTLVEIVLALMVAAVGIIGVMALFPVGLTKNKQTVSTRSAADAADQFLHSMAARVRADWNVTNAFPDAIPTMSEDGVTWSDATLLQNSNVTINFSAVNASDSFDPAVHQDGLFKIVQVTPSNIVDFTGVIRSWKELTEIGDSRLNGDLMPWGLLDLSNGADPIGYGFTYGEEYTLKHNSQGAVTPGNFGALNLAEAHGGGAAAYEGFIVNGGPSDVGIGDEFFPETGNMVGKTISGVNARVATTPYIRVPVVDRFPNGSSQRVKIVNFLPFKLLSCTGSGNTAATVKAVYIGHDAAGGGAIGTSSYKLTLKAEVSWPLEIPYSARQKEIFSVKLYKGGTSSSLSEVATP